MDILLRWAKPVRADHASNLDSGVHHVAVTFDDGFQSVLENGIPELVKRNIPSTIFIPTGFIGRYPEWDIGPDYDIAGERVVTENQIKNFPSNLVSIGSHSVSHSNLTVLEEDDVRNELYESRRVLESISGSPVTIFSFPFGYYNDKVLSLAREAGYQRVFTTLPTLVFTEPKEFVTGRVSVSPTEWRMELVLKLLGAYRWLPFVFSMKRKLLAMNKLKKKDYCFGLILKKRAKSEEIQS